MTLLKGIEEEVYAGTSDGDIVPLSPKIAAELDGFTSEPDGRNIEYTTDPIRDYAKLRAALMHRRSTLRDWLREHGDYSPIPGGTMSLGDSTTFHLSAPDNPYYAYIKNTYHSDVVTASAHLNIGIDDPEELMRVCQIIRMEACLYLALTAASPFLDDRVTGYHSTRWHQFPKTPPDVPLFESHTEFVGWVQGILDAGTIQRVAHLWVAVRPNGENPPQDLNRLELRICDRIDDPNRVLAMIALLEARVRQILAAPQMRVLAVDWASEAEAKAELQAAATANEAAVAKDSLDATVRQWHSGESVPVRTWLRQYLQDAQLTAHEHGFDQLLAPLMEIPDTGNVAQQWLARHTAGESIRDIVRDGIRQMAAAEGA